LNLKEQDKVKSKLATETTPRPALNSSNLGNDEFKSLGQASSELILKLSKQKGVGGVYGTSKPPPKMTNMGGGNVIYWKFNKTSSSVGKRYKNNVIYIWI
jgi:hypothetical protein